MLCRFSATDSRPDGAFKRRFRGSRQDSEGATDFGWCMRAPWRVNRSGVESRTSWVESEMKFRTHSRIQVVQVGPLGSWALFDIFITGAAQAQSYMGFRLSNSPSPALP